MDMSNIDESNSSENQQLPTFKDPKGCLDITTNHQKDDNTKKIIILHQDPRGCQDIIMDDQKNDDDDKNIVVLQQESKGCQDITMDEQKDDNANKIEILHQEDVTMGIKKIMVFQEDPKECQDITMNANIIEILHQEYGVVNDIIALQQPIVENKVVLEDDNDGFRTPTSLESKIPILTSCPGAPRRNYSGIKRKGSSSPPRRGERNIRLWSHYRRRDTARF